MRLSMSVGTQQEACDMKYLTQHTFYFAVTHIYYKNIVQNRKNKIYILLFNKRARNI